VSELLLTLIGILILIGLAHVVATVANTYEIKRQRKAIEIIGRQSDEIVKYLTNRDVIINPDDSTGEWERLT